MSKQRAESRAASPTEAGSKVSPVDSQALKRWNDYAVARNEMFAHTHDPLTPWTVVRADDKRLARLNLIKDLLSRLHYDGKDEAVLRMNPDIISSMRRHTFRTA